MALLSASCGSSAQKSPSGNIRAEVFADKEGLSYSVTHDGRTIIDTSAMGVTIDGTELFRDAVLRPAGTRKINETYSVTGRKAVSENRCNEYLFDVTHRPSGYTYQLQTRLYDDGFAYRFILPGDGKRIVITIQYKIDHNMMHDVFCCSLCDCFHRHLLFYPIKIIYIARCITHEYLQNQCTGFLYNDF